MNKSGIKITSFKNFFNKYFKIQGDVIILNEEVDDLSGLQDQRVSYMELNIGNREDRKDWLSYSYYPVLALYVEKNTQKENPLFGYVFLN